MTTTPMTIQERLAAPFDQTHLKDGLTYITGEQVTSRLNDVLGWDGWDFQVKQHGFDQESDEIWVLGTLTVYTANRVVIKEQFGSQKHNRKRADKSIIDYGFDMKGAATDAMKKCASLIGVGLYLAERQGAPAAPAPRQARPQPAAATTATAAPSRSFMESARALGFTVDEIEAESQKWFANKATNDLDLNEKAALYSRLLNMKKVPVNA